MEVPQGARGSDSSAPGKFPFNDLSAHPRGESMDQSDALSLFVHGVCTLTKVPSAMRLLGLSIPPVAKPSQGV